MNHAVIINILLAFAEGFALIISPCILPILPIILSGSLIGTRLRPYGIILGFITAFSLAVLFSRTLIQFLDLSPDILSQASYVFLAFLGVIMIFSCLTERFNFFTQRLTYLGSSLSVGKASEESFFSGFIFGGLVGIIWTPCAGPILAAALVQAATQKTTLLSFFVLFSFSMGAGIPMLLIALIGRKVMERFSIFRIYGSLFRKILGFIIIISVAFLYYSSNIVYSSSQSNDTPNVVPSKLVNGLEHPYLAPPIVGINAWINSSPLELGTLKGKVVLVDFWTYSCINCIRTLPYLKDWYAKYHQFGLEIIGIHSPEFEFEKDLSNVRKAVEKFGIRYPVGLDNEFKTWQSFHNDYWPAHYLINKDGQVVYEHFGEGEYDATENNIRYLLGVVAPSALTAESPYMSTMTPETYLGYERANHYAGLEKFHRAEAYHYSAPSVIPLHHWTLEGEWVVFEDKVVSASKGASIKLHFNAGTVYAVMGSATQPVKIRVKVVRGAQQSRSKGVIDQHELYTLASLKPPGEGMVEITASKPGLEVYTFTFGG